MIKYSIIIATYNNNKVLKNLLDSLKDCDILNKKDTQLEKAIEIINKVTEN